MRGDGGRVMIKASYISAAKRKKKEEEKERVRESGSYTSGADE